MDDSDFTELVTPHIAAMLRVAVALVGVADAEDATQEALMRAWQGWLTLHDAGALHTWLLRITLNVSRNWQRGRFGTRRRLTQALILDTDAGSDDLGISSNQTDPGTTEYADVLDLQASLALLSDEQRIIVALRYYAGMNASAIGTLLELPAATVRTRLRRALMHLRAILQPHEPKLDEEKADA